MQYIECQFPFKELLEGDYINIELENKETIKGHIRKILVPNPSISYSSLEGGLYKYENQITIKRNELLNDSRFVWLRTQPALEEECIVGIKTLLVSQLFMEKLNLGIEPTSTAVLDICNYSNIPVTSIRRYPLNSV